MLFINLKKEAVYSIGSWGEKIIVFGLSQGSSSFLDRSQLVKIRMKAMRAGVWYRALQRIDRVLVDVTISVAQSIRSVFLAGSLLSVVRKLEDVLEGKVSRAVREVGFPLAQKLSEFAQAWGYARAWAWASDPGFARFLAVMRLNG